MWRRDYASEMSKPTPTDRILELLASHRELSEDFKKDQTLVIASAAVESARRAVEAAANDDGTLDPEVYVDRKLQAEREFQIAEIKLTRAKAEVETRGDSVLRPLEAASGIAQAALLEATPRRLKKLNEGIAVLFAGDDRRINTARQALSSILNSVSREYADIGGRLRQSTTEDDFLALLDHSVRLLQLAD